MWFSVWSSGEGGRLRNEIPLGWAGVWAADLSPAKAGCGTSLSCGLKSAVRFEGVVFAVLRFRAIGLGRAILLPALKRVQAQGRGRSLRWCTVR